MTKSEEEQLKDLIKKLMNKVKKMEIEIKKDQKKILEEEMKKKEEASDKKYVKKFSVKKELENIFDEIDELDEEDEMDYGLLKKYDKKKAELYKKKYEELRVLRQNFFNAF
jgi:predicted  nucleic acid-binding Zn-ribbon protein